MANIGTGIQVIKVNKSTGAVIWKNVFGSGLPGGLDTAASIESTADGGFVIVGESPHFSANYKILLFKITSGGALSWTRLFGSGTSSDHGQGVIETSSGVYVISGSIASIQGAGLGGQNHVLFQYNSGGGTITWSTTTGTGGNEYMFGQSLNRTSDNGFIISGQNDVSGTHMVMSKFTSAGAYQWTRLYNGASGSDIIQTSGGDYIGVGSYSNAPFAIKMNSSGAIAGCSALTSQVFATNTGTSLAIATVSLPEATNIGTAGTQAFSEAIGGTFTNMCQ